MAAEARLRPPGAEGPALPELGRSPGAAAPTSATCAAAGASGSSGPSSTRSRSWLRRSAWWRWSRSPCPWRWRAWRTHGSSPSSTHTAGPACCGPRDRATRRRSRWPKGSSVTCSATRRASCSAAPAWRSSRPAWASGWWGRRAPCSFRPAAGASTASAWGPPISSCPLGSHRPPAAGAAHGRGGLCHRGQPRLRRSVLEGAAAPAGRHAHRPRRGAHGGRGRVTGMRREGARRWDGIACRAGMGDLRETAA